MTDIDYMIKSYETHLKRLTESNALNKAAIFAALAAASITLVTVVFDGGGDSGQIQEITARAGQATVEIPNTPVELISTSWGSQKTASSRVSLRDAIVELCFDYLSQEHGGWENNDGGQGEFTFHVEEQRVELDFNQFYTDSTNYTHTF